MSKTARAIQVLVRGMVLAAAGVSSVLAMAVLLAVLWLALVTGEGSPVVMGLALGVAVTFFLIILAVGRWLMRNRAPSAGIGCMASTFLVAGGMAASAYFSTESYAIGMLIGGIVGWIACTGKVVAIMAARELEELANRAGGKRVDGNDVR